VSTRRIPAHPPIGDLPLQHQISSHEPRPLSQQAFQQHRGHVVRRTRHHPERPARQPQITRISLNHRHRRISEPPTQPIRTTRMQLDRNHSRTGPNQRPSQRTKTGPDIKNELTGFDPGRVHNPLSPTTIERMPSPSTPPLPEAGHDGPSRST
jgi:hypothetical protein